MTRLLCFLFAMTTLCSAWAHAEGKFLHISTTPTGADVYLENTQPDYATKPCERTPAFVPVPEGESSMIISLFRPGFSDSVINVNLSANDTSYLIVTLSPVQSERERNAQEAILQHRVRKSFGHKLLWASAVPFIASGVAALIARHEIEEAKDNRDYINHSLLRKGSTYDKNRSDFKDHRENAHIAKKGAIAGLITGGVLLSAGIILSF